MDFIEKIDSTTKVKRIAELFLTIIITMAACQIASILSRHQMTSELADVFAYIVLPMWLFLLLLYSLLLISGNTIKIPKKSDHNE